METDLYDEDEYDLDSPEAILRCAVAVACVDGEFARDEQERVRDVYSDICQEMTFAYNRPDVSEDYQAIAETTSDFVLSLGTDDIKMKFIEHCGQSVTDRDLRELTLIVSLRIAGADADLAAEEFSALKVLANMWNIDLRAVLQPYLDL